MSDNIHVCRDCCYSDNYRKFIRIEFCDCMAPQCTPVEGLNSGFERICYAFKGKDNNELKEEDNG